MKEGKTFILSYRLYIGRRNRFLAANKSSNSNPFLGTFFTKRGLKSKIRQSTKYYEKQYREYQVFVYEMHIDGPVVLIEKTTLPELFPDLLEVEHETPEETKEDDPTGDAVYRRHNVGTISATGEPAPAKTGEVGGGESPPHPQTNNNRSTDQDLRPD